MQHSEHPLRNSAPVKAVSRHKKLSITLVSLLLLGLITLLLLPFAVRWGLEHWLESHGELEVRIENVDFNPFTGRLLVHSLIAQREQTGTMEWVRAGVEIVWWPIFKKRIQLDDVSLQNAAIRVRMNEKGRVFIGGVPLPAAQEETPDEDGWEIGFGEIDLNNVTVLYQSPRLNQRVMITTAHIDPMQSWNPESEADFRVQMTLEEGRIDVSGRTKPFGATPAVQGRIEIASLPLAWVNPLVPDFQITRGILMTDIAFSYETRHKEPPLLQTDGVLTLQDFSAEAKRFGIRPKTLSWNGRTSVTFSSGEDQPPSITAQGEVNATNIRAAIAEPHFRFRAEELHIGIEDGTAVPGNGPFQLKAGLRARGMELFDVEQDVILAATQAVDLQNLQASGTRSASLGSGSMTDARLLQRNTDEQDEPPYTIELSSFMLENSSIDVSKQRLDLGAVSLSGARLTVVRTEKGGMEFFELLPELPGRTGENATAENGIQPTEGEPWATGFNSLALDNVLVQYRSPEIDQDITVTRVRAEPMQSWNPDASGNFRAQLAIDGGNILLQGSATPYASTPTVQGRLEVASLPIALTNPFVPNLDMDGGTLEAESEFLFEAGQDVAPIVQTNGTMTVRDMSLTTEQLGIRPRTLSWDGRTSVELPFGNRDGSKIQASGNLNASEFRAALSDPHLRTQADAIAVDLDLSMNTREAGAPPDFQIQAAVDANTLQILDPDQNLILTAANSLELRNVQFSGIETFAMGSGTLNNARFLQRNAQEGENQPYVLDIAALNVRDSQVNIPARRIELGSLQLSEVRGIILRNEEGEMEILRLLPQFLMEEEDQEEGEKTTVALEEGSLDKNSAVRFRDDSVDPPVDLTLNSIEAGIQNLNTADSDRKLPVRFQADIGRYTSLHFDGTVQPFTDLISADVQGEIQRLSLPELTGYAERHTGYAIQSGQLYSDFSVLIDRAELDATFKLFITRLQMRDLRPEEEDKFTEEIGVPLSTAVGLLQNDDKEIELTIPVQGSIRDPDVGTGGAVAEAVQSATFSAIKTGALAYFAPLGAAYAAGKLLGKATALRFEPVIFTPGNSTLDSEDRQYLNQIAEKLKNRPEVTLLLCGMAVPADRNALQQAAEQQDSSDNEGRIPDELLNDLAESRAESVKDHLVQQGIDPGRLSICDPEIETDQDARPRVEVGI